MKTKLTTNDPENECLKIYQRNFIKLGDKAKKKLSTSTTDALESFIIGAQREVRVVLLSSSSWLLSWSLVLVGDVVEHYLARREN